jgi:hypothetical protein
MAGLREVAVKAEGEGNVGQIKDAAPFGGTRYRGSFIRRYREPYSLKLGLGRVDSFLSWERQRSILIIAADCARRRCRLGSLGHARSRI